MKVRTASFSLKEEDELSKNVKAQGKLYIALYNFATKELIFDELKVKGEHGVSGHPCFDITMSEKNKEILKMVDSDLNDTFVVYSSDIDIPLLIDTKNGASTAIAFVSANKINADIIDIFKGECDKLIKANEDHFTEQRKAYEARKRKFQIATDGLKLQKEASSLIVDTKLLEKYNLSKAAYLQLIKDLDRYYKNEELESEDQTTKQYLDEILSKDGVISLAYTDTTTSPEYPIEVEYDLKDRHMKTYVNHDLVEDIDFDISSLEFIDFSSLTGEWEEYDPYSLDR